MSEEEWKKNDALMKTALKKMNIVFRRDPETWEAHAFVSNLLMSEYVCIDLDDNISDDGPSTPESLGNIVKFEDYRNFGQDCRCISNIFFGVKNYEELKIKLDLMA